MAIILVSQSLEMQHLTEAIFIKGEGHLEVMDTVGDRNPRIDPNRNRLFLAVNLGC